MLRQPTGTRLEHAAFSPVERRTVVVARTGEGLRSLGPYVAAMRDDGAVLFQGEHADGSTGVHVVPAGRAPRQIIPAPPGCVVTSHPDSGSVGSVCFYAQSPGDGAGLWLASEGGCTCLATGCGPLGPTMDASGSIAFRTIGARGQGVGVWDGSRARSLDESGPGTLGLEGLPVVAGGRVAWRVTLAGEAHAIRLWDGRSLATVATTGDQFAAIARFPMMDRAGRIVFGARSRSGADGLYVWDSGSTRRVAGSDGRFESIRGGLISDRGTLLLIGTPRAGGLGVFTDELGASAIVQVGAPLDGSPVEEFAVNAVSVNASDQVAIRATLADGRQVIARSDPASVA